MLVICIFAEAPALSEEAQDREVPGQVRAQSWCHFEPFRPSISTGLSPLQL
jgi:hypothetical protein